MEKLHYLLVAGLAGGCFAARSAAPHPEAPRPLRVGLERTGLPYDDPHALEKAVLLEQINRDRADHGVPSVAYDPRAARVGDLFCLDAALAGSVGHWDRAGRAPFLRWGLAGGVDYHAENAAAYSDSSGALGRGLADLLLVSHEAMMAETPPDDGHRRTILDPRLTHVGIGMAALGGEFRMTEEFTRVAFEWVEAPREPLAPGAVARLAGRPLRGLVVGAVEIRFEPPPRPLSLFELRQRRSYAYPPVVRTLRPRLPPGLRYKEAGVGDFFVARDGRFAVSFPLDSGPGYYFVLCQVAPRASHDGIFAPATAAMVTALP